MQLTILMQINDDDKEIDVTKCNNIKASMETLTDQLYYGEVYYDEVGDIMVSSMRQYSYTVHDGHCIANTVLII